MWAPDGAFPITANALAGSWAVQATSPAAPLGAAISKCFAEGMSAPTRSDWCVKCGYFVVPFPLSSPAEYEG